MVPVCVGGGGGRETVSQVRGERRWRGRDQL